MFLQPWPATECKQGHGAGPSTETTGLQCRTPGPGCAQGQKLSAKEERELAYKRQVYELAKLRQAQQEELDARDEYHMPLDASAAGARSSRYDVLTARYKCGLIPKPVINPVARPHPAPDPHGDEGAHAFFGHLPKRWQSLCRLGNERRLPVWLLRLLVCHQCWSQLLFRALVE